MDKHALLQKLDEGVSSFRSLLAEHDGSTLKAIAASAKQGFDSLKVAFDQNEKAQKAMTEIKKQMQELESAIQAGDRKLSATILAAVEKKIRHYKEKYAEDTPAAAGPETAGAAGKGKKSTVAGSGGRSAKRKVPASAGDAASVSKRTRAGKERKQD